MMLEPAESGLPTADAVQSLLHQANLQKVSVCVRPILTANQA